MYKSNRSSILEGLGLKKESKVEVKIDEVKTDDIAGMAKFVVNAISNRHGIRDVTLEKSVREGNDFHIVVSFKSPILVGRLIEEQLGSDLSREILGNFAIPVSDTGSGFNVKLCAQEILEDCYKVYLEIFN